MALLERATRVNLPGPAIPPFECPRDQPAGVAEFVALCMLHRIGRVSPAFHVRPAFPLGVQMPGVIQLRTEVPGPKSRALLARRAQAVPRGVPAVTPIAVVHAEGAVVTDADGNRLIDFGGGIGVVNTGHRHPSVVAAVRAQLDRFAHVCFPVSTYEPYVELAERLNRITPGKHPKRTFLLNSGAEAVENAVKVARFFTGRQAVVCFEHGFHGRTNLALALTSKVMPYKKGFGPFAPEVYRVPFPYCYRCGEAGKGISAEAGGCCMASRERLEQIFASTVDPDSVAAIIMELELGEGGFVPAPKEYIEELAEFARDHGILFIADEIQTGFGRTGKLFASEHYGLVPDIIITAWVEPTEVTPCLAPRPWPFWTPWRPSGSQPALPAWESASGLASANGQRATTASGTCAVWERWLGWSS
jgi:4-aminobutyrate aminotransferase-like enzyme